MRRRFDARPPGFWLWGDGAFPVLILFGLEAGAIHAGARRLGFVGDSWAIFTHAAAGWWSALSTPLGYHYIPLAAAWSRLHFLLLGSREPLYAIANVGELTVVGWLTFLLGRRLLGDPLPGLLAGGLLIGSAGFPDITYWSLVGNFHCLATAFAIGAIAAAASLAEENPSRGAAWGFAAAMAGAAFTYEGTIPLLPSAILWCLIRTAQRTGIRSVFSLATLRQLFRAFAPSLPVIAVLLYGKVHFAVATATAMAPGFGWDRLHSLAHSLLGIFTLRSSYDVLEHLLFLGSPATASPSRSLLLVGFCLAVVIGLILRARPGAGLLALWITLQLTIGVIALPLASRHRFLPSVAGLLLLSLGFCQLGRALARRFATASPWRPPSALDARSLALGVPITLCLALLFSAQGELHRAQELYRRSGDALHLSIEQGQALLPLRNSPAILTLVNAPGHLVDGGITAPTFDNATTGLVLFRLNNARLELIHTWIDLPGWQAAGVSRPVDAAELLHRVGDPFRAVVSLNRTAERIQPLTLEGFRPPEP